MYCNVNFNILKQFNCALVGQTKDLMTSKCTVQLWGEGGGEKEIKKRVFSFSVLLSTFAKFKKRIY